MKIGMDIGGTNTDAVILDDAGGIVYATKTLTTKDTSIGFSLALKEILHKTEILPTRVEAILLGTTHAVNAVLERKDLYKVGLIRLAGHMPDSLPPCFSWPSDLKEVVFVGVETINGGYECNGNPITEVIEEEVRLAISSLLKKGAESLAIVGVFSAINPAQEKEVGNIIEEMLGEEFPYSLSYALGGIGCIERENTTLLNSALKKVMQKGFRALEKEKEALGFKCPLWITQNNGSLISLLDAVQHPVLTISAGPTNSFLGAVSLANIHDAIVVDIGGTSTDVGIVKNKFPRRSHNTSNIGGVKLNFSMPDVRAIGLGGGSHISFNEEEGVTIGPKSVARNLLQEALSFGGGVLTLTDVALKLSLIDIPNAQTEKVELTLEEVEAIFKEVLRKIENEVAIIQGDAKDLPILLVGGGAHLIPKKYLEGRFRIPPYAHVANAYGAALSEITGVVDSVVSLEKREEILKELSLLALSRAKENGASSQNLRIVEREVIPYHYVPNQMARVRITAAGMFQGRHGPSFFNS